MRLLASLLLSLAILAPQAATAGPAATALGECLKDNTSGKDRKDLARWVFISMSAHPDMRSLATVSQDAQLDSDKRMAAVLTRLLSETCPTQTRAAVEQEGQPGLFNSFKVLGEVAMLELMSNPEVTKTISGYVQHVDMAKLEKVLKK